MTQTTKTGNGAKRGGWTRSAESIAKQKASRACNKMTPTEQELRGIRKSPRKITKETPQEISFGGSNPLIPADEIHLETFGRLPIPHAPPETTTPTRVKRLKPADLERAIGLLEKAVAQMPADLSRLQERDLYTVMALRVLRLV